MVACQHPDPRVVRRMVSLACEECGEMWAKEDEVGNYKEQYDAEHAKLLKAEEDARRERNAATERERKFTTEALALYKKIAEIKAIAER